MLFSAVPPKYNIDRVDGACAFSTPVSTLCTYMQELAAINLACTIKMSSDTMLPRGIFDVASRASSSARSRLAAMAEPLNDKNRFVRRWIDSREQGETVMPFTHSKQGEAAASTLVVKPCKPTLSESDSGKPGLNSSGPVFSDDKGGAADCAVSDAPCDRPCCVWCHCSPAKGNLWICPCCGYKLCHRCMGLGNTTASRSITFCSWCLRFRTNEELGLSNGTGRCKHGEQSRCKWGCRENEPWYKQHPRPYYLGEVVLIPKARCLGCDKTGCNKPWCGRVKAESGDDRRCTGCGKTGCKRLECKRTGSTSCTALGASPTGQGTSSSSTDPPGHVCKCTASFKCFGCVSRCKQRAADDAQPTRLRRISLGRCPDLGPSNASYGTTGGTNDSAAQPKWGTHDGDVALLKLLSAKQQPKQPSRRAAVGSSHRSQSVRANAPPRRRHGKRAHPLHGRRRSKHWRNRRRNRNHNRGFSASMAANRKPWGPWYAPPVPERWRNIILKLEKAMAKRTEIQLDNLKDLIAHAVSTNRTEERRLRLAFALGSITNLCEADLHHGACSHDRDCRGDSGGGHSCGRGMSGHCIRPLRHDYHGILDRYDLEERDAEEAEKGASTSCSTSSTVMRPPSSTRTPSFKCGMKCKKRWRCLT